MTYQEAIEHFGTQVRMGEALGIAQPTISQWDRVIPKAYQYQIEVITGGKLLVDPEYRGPANGQSAQAAA